MATHFTSDRLLICEGPEDRALVEQMIRENRCPTMDIIDISETKTGNGITGIQKHLVALPGLTGFSGVKSIGIFVDSDADSKAMEQFVCQQITEANKHPDVAARYSVPDESFVKATNSTVSTTIILSPGKGEIGCLETLLLRVLRKNYGQQTRCVDAFMGCAELRSDQNGWTKSKIDKAAMRVAIAAIYKMSPAIALSILWKNDPTIIPVSDASFNDLSASLGLV